jgi:hypothetical protein
MNNGVTVKNSVILLLIFIILISIGSIYYFMVYQPTQIQQRSFGMKQNCYEDTLKYLNYLNSLPAAKSNTSHFDLITSGYNKTLNTCLIEYSTSSTTYANTKEVDDIFTYKDLVDWNSNLNNGSINGKRINNYNEYLNKRDSLLGKY